MLSKVRYIDIQIRRYIFLKSLIIHYHTDLKRWLSEEKKMWQNESIILSEGDKEIEQSIFSQQYGSLGRMVEQEEQQFNLSIFLMVYSYYESVKRKMAIIVGSDQDRPLNICEKLSDSLSQSSTKKSEHINSIAHPLRNLVCHNISGTNGNKISDTRNAIEELLRMRSIEMYVVRDKNNEIDLEMSQLFNIKKDYILDVLEKEHDILVEIASKSLFTAIEKQYFENLKKDMTDDPLLII